MKGTQGTRGREGKGGEVKNERTGGEGRGREDNLMKDEGNGVRE